ncbi:SDR family oxidoreductase [Pseudomonas stutzeri]|uniref:SDR family oxidoreductase n=1 Tax=Stutzerimonas stutzeri TaxID=316 RepID=UPI000C9AA727|nr:SDR family oxidoreductase [Stutzerimonas stutzeri]MCQ4280461.1 SDR family oxidoreductase [Stutzerimonas stutzeri]PNF71504.1 3-oxoacyl-ACP reductase [Stutzerimonas stutzeri]
MKHAGPKIALVTGAGSGIGKAAAIALAGGRYTVILAGRRLDRLQNVQAEIQTRFGSDSQSYPVAADVSNPDDVAQLFDLIGQQYGRLDLLFNNAGRGNPPGSFLEWSAQQWNEVVGTNLNGMFFCLQHAFRLMSRQSPRGGRIINNGSLSAYSPRPNSVAYTATKHAVTGLTKAACLEGRQHDIAVGQIDIGNAMSELAEPMANGTLQANGEITPEPLIDVELVGRAVLQMANLPLEANVLFQTLMATKMPFVGRG